MLETPKVLSTIAYGDCKNLKYVTMDNQSAGNQNNL